MSPSCWTLLAGMIVSDLGMVFQRGRDKCMNLTFTNGIFSSFRTNSKGLSSSYSRTRAGHRSYSRWYSMVWCMVWCMYFLEIGPYCARLRAFIPPRYNRLEDGSCALYWLKLKKYRNINRVDTS